MKNTYTRWQGGRLVRTQVPFLLTRIRFMRWDWRVIRTGLELHDDVWGMLLWGVSLVVLAFALTGCGTWPDPPRAITVSPNLPDAVLLGVVQARDAWCAAPVGWCPELVESGGDSDIVVAHFAGEVTEEGSGVAAYNHNGVRIFVSQNAVDSGEKLGGALAHEFGHFGIAGHVEASPLMRAETDYLGDVEPRVDAFAAMQWCREQGCP
jgi:hypothetical protein